MNIQFVVQICVHGSAECTESRVRRAATCREYSALWAVCEVISGLWCVDDILSTVCGVCCLYAGPVVLSGVMYGGALGLWWVLRRAWCVVRGVLCVCGLTARPN